MTLTSGTNRAAELREDALAIWQAGVDAVRSDGLVQRAVRIRDHQLVIGDQRFSLEEIGRIVVVGCGKAGAGMATGLELALGQELCQAKRVEGWVNVPDDCVRQLEYIHLHGARPAGVNEPTAGGVAGTQHILQLVESLNSDDLCICLISGGGSALMPLPVEGITLEDKLAVTKHLSGAGADIQQLNTVRKQLSGIKGGGLARACRAGHLVSLIISDVLGDPLDVIASGPTVRNTTSATDALAVLEQFDSRAAGISERVFDYLRQVSQQPDDTWRCQVSNQILGNNQVAAEAAAVEARRRGFETVVAPIDPAEGAAEQKGLQLVDAAIAMREAGGKRCLISGGEPTVTLAPSDLRGMGGRNQQLVLAALQRLQRERVNAEGFVVLSGGTDGEDGPTDAAGALVDGPLLADVQARSLDPADALSRNDAYTFFRPLGGLIQTGPTHTNVCDLRVVLSAG